MGRKVDITITCDKCNEIIDEDKQYYTMLKLTGEIYDVYGDSGSLRKRSWYLCRDCAKWFKENMGRDD